MSFTPVDGQITSLEQLNLPLTGGEVMEIVSPGNAAQGNSYQVTLTQMAGFFSANPATTEVILSGATSINPYLILPNDGIILFNKTAGSASFTIAPLASSMFSTNPILIKDLKGDAATNPITISFTGIQLCDGLASIVISNDYGWTRITPAPGGAAWYQS